jgi:PAS domain S-box-containing protein
MTNARILIVEDEGLVARDIHTQLLRGQYSVVGVAASGEEAVALANAEKPDLVLMDMKLEGEMDGINAAREIRERIDVPVIYLTAFADDETLARARLTEPFGYILKPFAEPELKSVIEMALYKHAAERKLRLSEKRFHVTLSSIGDAVIATDEHGAITFMNPAAEELTQRPLSLALDDRFEETFRVRSERAAQIDAVAEALRVGAVVALPADILLVRPDGTELPIEATSAPIRDDGGAVSGVVVVFHDATQRRVAEERYRQSQKMEAVGQLAGGVAHDFNNILTVIGCYCALARAALPDAHPVKTYVDQVNEAAGQAATLTRQLLAFGRKQLLVPRVLDLNRVLTDAEGMLRRVLGEDIAFTLRLTTRIGRVRVDPRQLDQVIVNLALNARDAMPMGGELHIETAALELPPDSQGPGPSSSYPPGGKPKGHVVMVVRDTGIGMTPETKARIFEPFFTTKEKGSGLGLSTVYGIIEQSGGRIEVESEIGVGTTIHVILPGVEAEAEAVARTEHEHVGGGHETILLVEDEAELRRVITIVLSERGYRVLSAESAEEAADILEEWTGPLHLLLTDVVMPKVSGPELAEHLRAARPGLRVLFMSGYADDAVVRRGVQAGVMPLLNKPFMPEALARKVREVLDSPPPTGPMRIPVTPVAGIPPRR